MKKTIAAITIIFIVLIICVSMLLGLHMCGCMESGVKMFADPKHEERIRALEKDVKQLKERE